jgi:hypothetical protein
VSFRIERPLNVSVERSLHADARMDYEIAAFCRTDQE